MANKAFSQEDRFGVAIPQVYLDNGDGTFTLIVASGGSYTSTDKSGTITTGGTAQTVIAANTARRGWQLSNLSAAIMYVRDDGSAATATTGVPVNPGQSVDDGGRCSTAAISVYCATTGAAFSAKEYV